jgi:hypothetical protein
LRARAAACGCGCGCVGGRAIRGPPTKSYVRVYGFEVTATASVPEPIEVIELHTTQDFFFFLDLLRVKFNDFNGIGSD